MSPAPAIRPATVDDAAFLAGIVLRAGRSHVRTSFWDLLLDFPGDAELERFLVRMLRAPQASWWYAPHFLVAEFDGRPAAALCAFAPGDPAVEPPAATVTRALREHGLAEEDMASCFRRAKAFFHCTHDPAPGTWWIENVATLPEARRRGLVAALLREVLGEGRARGHSRTQLACFVGNEPAQRAYEAQGFRVVVERRHPEFEAAVGCPGILQMECAP